MKRPLLTLVLILVCIAGYLISDSLSSNRPGVRSDGSQSPSSPSQLDRDASLERLERFPAVPGPPSDPSLLVPEAGLGAIKVTVINHLETHQPGATVIVTSRIDGRSISLVSDSGGIAVFPNLNPGEYSVSCGWSPTAGGFFPSNLFVETDVVAGLVRELTLAQKRPCQVMGRVIHTDGSPIQGVALSAISQALPGAGVITAVSSESGAFELIGIPPGNFAVTTNRPVFSPQVPMFLFPGEQAEIEIVLHPPANIVVDSLVGKSPVTGARVSILHEGSDATGFRQFEYQTQSNGRGPEFRFPPGYLSVTVSPPRESGLGSWCGTIELPLNKNEITLSLPPSSPKRVLFERDIRDWINSSRPEWGDLYPVCYAISSDNVTAMNCEAKVSESGDALDISGLPAGACRIVLGLCPGKTFVIETESWPTILTENDTQPYSLLTVFPQRQNGSPSSGIRLLKVEDIHGARVAVPINDIVIRSQTNPNGRRINKPEVLALLPSGSYKITAINLMDAHTTASLNLPSDATVVTTPMVFPD